MLFGGRAHFKKNERGLCLKQPFSELFRCRKFRPVGPAAQENTRAEIGEKAAAAPGMNEPRYSIPLASSIFFNTSPAFLSPER